MRIIKHKSRRCMDPAPFYFVVEGVHGVATAEEATDIAFDVYREQVKAAPQAKTLWNTYGAK